MRMQNVLCIRNRHCTALPCRHDREALAPGKPMCCADSCRRQSGTVDRREILEKTLGFGDEQQLIRISQENRGIHTVLPDSHSDLLLEIGSKTEELIDTFDGLRFFLLERHELSDDHTTAGIAIGSLVHVLI